MSHGTGDECYQQQDPQAGSRKLGYDVEDASHNTMVPTHLHTGSISMNAVTTAAAASAAAATVIQSWYMFTIVASVTAGFRWPPETLAVAYTAQKVKLGANSGSGWQKLLKLKM